ncbi:MAG: DEAD/DEAH box helicase [Treponema sp.]|nr:DEAD/DEAH box helicase [Treponema sp.]
MTTDFKQLGIEQPLLDRLSAINITNPTAVQSKVIPLIAEGSHLLFQSETGTGKTFAYLLPLIQKFSKEENPNRQIQFLIASPTLELASQIRNQIKLISDLKCTLLIGGSPLSRQIEALKEKPAIVIGGPARILELIHLKKLKTDGIKALVLDEADRLLSPELRDATEGLIERLPEDIQLIGNSATVSNYTKKILLKSRNKDDILLVELPAEDILRKRITHWAIFAERRDKIDTLRAFINAEKPEKLIVFTSRSDQIDNIVSKLQWKKIACAGLSAKTDKKSRKTAFDQFKSGKIPILVTTDLASRGLDIQGITHVVQMDLPESEDFFIHRAGRTGRAGKTGINCVIGDEREMTRYALLEKKLKLTVYPKVLYGGKVIAPE